jgi:cobalt-zinc-cadmium efflux system outer membrane protein
LSMEAAVARALEREPALRSARTEVDAARARRVNAGLRPNPTASFERREEPGGTDNQTTIGMEWPLDLFRRPARVAIADREVEATEQSVTDRARLLAAEVRTQYGEAAAAVRDVAVTDNLALSARRELELLRARVTEGASPPLDRDLLEVELRRFESDRLIAAGRAEASLFALKRLLGDPTESPVKLRDTLETLVQRMDRPPSEPPAQPDTALARADVREAAVRVRLAEARIDRARSEGRFDVSAFGTYMRMDAGFPQRGFDSQGSLERVRGVFNYVAAGVMVTVPLRNRNQGDIAAAEAERVGAEASLEAARLTAESEIAAASARDAQARQAVGLYEQGIRLARQNLDIVRQTYELGGARIADVLMEQRRYLDIERAFTDTLREAFNALTALRRARGEL